MKRLVPILVFAVIFATALQLPVAGATGDIIIEETFSGGLSAWTTTGSVRSEPRIANGGASARLRAGASISRTISLPQLTSATVSWAMAARSLERDDLCIVETATEVTGTEPIWRQVAQLANGEDNADFRTGSVGLGLSSSSTLSIRFRIGGAGADYCYVDDVIVTSRGSTNPPVDRSAVSLLISKRAYPAFNRCQSRRSLNPKTHKNHSIVSAALSS